MPARVPGKRLILLLLLLPFEKVPAIVCVVERTAKHPIPDHPNPGLLASPRCSWAPNQSINRIRIVRSLLWIPANT